jgi:hypothetical protein
MCIKYIWKNTQMDDICSSWEGNRMAWIEAEQKDQVWGALKLIQEKKCTKL